MLRKLEFKPLLFTTTVRNPIRMKYLLNVFHRFNGQVLTNELTIQIMGDLIRYGLYKPMKVTSEVKQKWKEGILLENVEVNDILQNNPQHHKEAGFEVGWPSRFATIFDLAKELGFVYYLINEEIKFSEIGERLCHSIEITLRGENIIVSENNPEFEQQAFLHAFAKYQRRNPFVRVSNNNIPLILLLEVIEKLNSDPAFNSSGIARHELPLLLFWKNNDADALYKEIKDLRSKYGYTPSDEVIVDICVGKIMENNFKKFNPYSITNEYPDEFIRKMRLTGLISLRGGGRFIDINKNEIDKVNYILKTYSSYKIYESEVEYFNYISSIDENLIKIKSIPINVGENNKLLNNWIEIYSWDKIKSELRILSKNGDRLSTDNILKYLSGPIRLEFLTSLAIKTRFPNVTVMPNYPCDDEGIPTSTAGGIGDKGDIECYEDENGVLIEVTLSQGRSQTMMEVWPIARHLEAFSSKVKDPMCYFIAPTLFKDTIRQINYVRDTENLYIEALTIDEFVTRLEIQEKLYT